MVRAVNRGDESDACHLSIKRIHANPSSSTGSDQFPSQIDHAMAKRNLAIVEVEVEVL